MRLIAALLALLAAPAAEAACSGVSLLDRLDAEQRAAFDARVAAVPYGEGLLWRAERDGAEIVLAGTLHLPDPRLAPIMDRLRPELAAADRVLLEMTPAERAQMEAAIAEDPSRMFLEDGPTLPELLTEAEWELVSEAARARGIPPFMASKFRPWFLMISLGMPPCAMPELSSGDGGLDEMVMAASEDAGVPMAPLEPWDTILNLFETGTAEEQLDLLRASLVAPDFQEEALVAVLDGYFAGRTAEVWEVSRLAMELVPGVDRAEADALFDLTERELLIDRNRAWIPVIEEAAGRDGRIVVAAGAGHLPGEEGLLALLAERGWEIAPLAP